MTGHTSFNKRIFWAFIFFCLLFASLIVHLYRVQILRHKELYAKARAKYTFEAKTIGIRGEIFDYSGNMLVGNIPAGNVIADPSAIKTEEEGHKIAAFLAPLLELPEEEIYKKLNDKTIVIKKANGEKKISKRKYAVLKKDIEFKKFVLIRLEIDKSKLKCLQCTITRKRTYPKGKLLANLLGHTSIDRDQLIPKGGLEKSYDKGMSPVAGKKVYERSRDGRPLSFGEISLEKMHDGSNLYLTIREPIQAIMEEEIDKMMAATGCVRGYAVMADPYTGDIWGIAQRPTFDPNDRKNLQESASRNPVAEIAYEPGSIMKPFPVAGALDLGIVTPNTIFDCEGGKWHYAGKRLNDSHYIGKVTVSDIIQQSSNIGTAKIALEIGEPRLKQILMSFGFGQKTGVPLRPETIGLFYRRPSKISLTRYPIGQGNSCSALQLTRAYCILANGGWDVKLRLVDRLENPDTGARHVFPVQKGKNIFRRPQTYKEMVNMMKRVTMPGGTSFDAAVPQYFVAGKTGTAQKFVNGAYSHEKYTASFVGFVPADRPCFVLLVTGDEPLKKNDNYYGGKVGGPCFRAIAERTLHYLNIPPDISLEAYNAHIKDLQRKNREAKVKVWAMEREERERRRNAKLNRQPVAKEKVSLKKRTKTKKNK